jgi:hypothetical protein
MEGPTDSEGSSGIPVPPRPAAGESPTVPALWQSEAPSAAEGDTAEGGAALDDEGPGEEERPPVHLRPRGLF